MRKGPHRKPRAAIRRGDRVQMIEFSSRGTATVLRVRCEEAHIEPALLGNVIVSMERLRKVEVQR